jgi:hypothetical protein
MPFDFDAHVCLVSAQQAPNLIPALDPDLGPKAQKVYLVVSSQMKQNAGRLAKVLKRHGLTAECISVSDAYDYEAIWNTLAAFLDQAERDHANIALNMTGGTKIMALAAQSAFETAGRPSFYVNESNFKALVLENTSKRETLQIPLQDGLTWRDYLDAYGFETKKGDNPLSKAEFTKALLENPKKYEKGLATLRRLIQGSPDSLNFDFSHVKGHPLFWEEGQNPPAVLNLCADHDLVVIDRPGEWRFKDERARKYIDGGWLEEYVYAAVCRLGGDKIRGKALGLDIATDNSDVPNELDVAFMAGNRLHIIECKTGLQDEEKTMPILDKLRNLQTRTGLKTKTMLVSLQSLDRTSTKTPNTNRAEEYGIRVLQKDQLRNLQSELEKWIAS